MCFNKEMRGKIMNYIYDYISEERKKEIAYMNIVDTYNRTGYLDIPGDKVVKSKDEYFLFWYNSPDTLCLRQQIEETGSSSIGKKRYMLIYGDKYMNIEISWAMACSRAPEPMTRTFIFPPVVSLMGKSANLKK